MSALLFFLCHKCGQVSYNESWENQARESGEIVFPIRERRTAAYV